MGLLEDLSLKVKRGEGPLFSAARSIAKGLLHTHLPDNAAIRQAAGMLYVGSVFAREFAGKMEAMLWAEPLLRSRCARVGKNLFVEKVPYIMSHAEIIIGDNVTIAGKINIFSGRFKDKPQLIIGNNVHIGPNCVFTVNDRIEIKDHASLAGDVNIFDSDAHPIDWERRAANDILHQDEMKPVVIGEHVWVGGRSQILKGVTVGDRAIIGAGSVVMSDVPEDTYAMGSPARKIRISS